MRIFVNCLCLACVVILCVFVVPYVYLYYVCIAVLSLDAGLLAGSQYLEGPATGHFNMGLRILVSLCLQANAEIVKFPSCYYMPFV